MTDYTTRDATVSCTVRPMSDKPIAVIGATGTVGSRIVRQLEELGVPVRAASRRGPVRFDWTDESTYAPVVEGARAVYLLPPVESVDPAPPMRRLVEVALAAGVPRLVLQSATIIEPGDAGIGEIHELLAGGTGEWAVVRPTWFMQNLQPGHGHYVGDEIVTNDRIPTSVGDGRIAFVDADDIAAVAVHALTAGQAPQTDYLVTGPAAVSYDEIAATISKVSGRNVVHERVSTAEVERIMVEHGMLPVFATYLAGLENDLRDDSASTVFDGVERATGRPPRSLQSWAEANAGSWR